VISGADSDRRSVDERRTRAAIVPRTALLAALVVGALALRPQLTAVGPLLPEIQADLGVDHARGGLLATIPILCMGLFGLSAARVLRRVDVRTAIAGCLAVVAAATLLRAVMPGFAAVLALTFPFGIAAGVMGALLPVVVKEGFGTHAVLGTGVFAFALNVGASLGAGLAVPLATVTGSWRWSFGLLAAAGALCLPGWIRLSRSTLGGALPVATGERLPWRSPFAWAATVVFALQALCFFALNAWLADAMIERGWTAGRAGALVALFNIIPLVGVVLVSIFGGRRVGIRAYLAVSAAGLVAGSAAIAHGSGAAWGWIVLLGLSLGSLFALAMALSVVAARAPGEVAASAAMQLGVGYIVAALAPVALGLLRDATGGFGAGLWLVAGLAFVLLLAVAAVAVLLPEDAR
jgi:MFS transporter, CP family, cyanate transporter